MNRRTIIIVVVLAAVVSLGIGAYFGFQFLQIPTKQRALSQLENRSFVSVQSSDFSGVNTIALTRFATDVPLMLLPEVVSRQFSTQDITLCANAMESKGLDSAICAPHNDGVAILSPTDNLQSGASVVVIAQARAPNVPFSEYYLCGYSDLPLISFLATPSIIQTGDSPLTVTIGHAPAAYYSAWTCLSAPASSLTLRETVRFIRAGFVLPKPGRYTSASIYAFNSNGFTPSIFFERIQKESAIDVINSYENVNIVRIEGAVQ